jgi:penicillin-binding protein A
MLLCFAVVLVQLTHIQFGEAKKLADSPDNPKNFAAKYDNQRGYILAADGTILAKSVLAPTGSPQKYERVYPSGPLFSGIVGYSSPYWGSSGVESVYNDDLIAHSQPAQSLSQLLNPPPKTTDTVSLTIQPYLQQAIANALQQNLVGRQYTDAAVVAMDPRTGAIEGMYSNVTYDPNALVAPLVNNQALTNEINAGEAARKPDAEGVVPAFPMATFNAFTPGSTFKVVTTAAAYNQQPSQADFTMDFPNGCTAPGQIPYFTGVVCNDSSAPPGNPCGGTIQQMLPESCDPGYAMLGLAVGAPNLTQQAAQFGWNKKPPVDVTDVSASHMDSESHLGKNGNQAALAQSAFGQLNDTATALQNAMVAEGIADNGVVMTPHVMAEIRDSQGGLVQIYQPSKYMQATSAAAAEVTNTDMQEVVTSGTASEVGFDPSMDVAAKTGTAQTFFPTPNSNTPATHDWMIAFAPANNPQIAVAVVVPYQSQQYDTGATVAGPIMKAVLTAALTHG